MDALIDRNGVEINDGDTVDVGSPRRTDNYENEFRGTVVDIYDDGSKDGIICVCDAEGDCFDVDADNVEVV